MTERTEYFRAWRNKNPEKVAEYNKRWRENHSDKIQENNRKSNQMRPKRRVKKQIVSPPPECNENMMRRKCSVCGGLTFIDPTQKTGNCMYCGSPYTVKYHLNGISIEGPYNQRNYEEEIISYIRTHQTYSREIMKNLHIAEGTVYSIISRLKEKNIISVAPDGHRKILILNNHTQINVKSEWVEA